MKREAYLKEREGLMAEAQNLIDEGNYEDAALKAKEVETLDAKWEDASRVRANLAALDKPAPHTDVTEGGVNMTGKVVDTMSGTPGTEVLASMEYRKAFMNHVVKGAEMPAEFKDEVTKTTDIGVAIPTTVMEKIVEKLESTGMILSRVTMTSYKGGLAIPKATVKPVAEWVAEDAGSSTNRKPTGNIIFAGHKLRCKISVSLAVDVMSIEAFETSIANSIVEAMIKALEKAIISGDGNGKPKGILSEEVPAGQNVDIAAGADPTYQDLLAAEAAIPLAYENTAEWAMTKKTFMKFAGMVDQHGQPICRVNFGLNGKIERSLLGRTVVLNEYMPSIGEVEEDTVVAFIFNFKDYVVNTNYEMAVKKYEDNETDNQVTKAVMLADGKVVDENSLVTVTKKA